MKLAPLSPACFWGVPLCLCRLSGWVRPTCCDFPFTFGLENALRKPGQDGGLRPAERRRQSWQSPLGTVSPFLFTVHWQMFLC